MRNTSKIKRSVVTVAPTVEPLSLQEVKDHLRVTDSAEDSYITALIVAARQYVEKFINKKLITQTVQDWRDRFSFSVPIWEGVRYGSITEFQARVLETAFYPVQSVDEISTFDRDDDETVFSAGNYQTDTVDEDLPGRIILRDGASWPTSLRIANAVKVEYTAGYGDTADDVPQSIRQGLLMTVAYMFEKRGDCDVQSAIRDSGGVAFLRQERELRI